MINAFENLLHDDLVDLEKTRLIDGILIFPSWWQELVGLSHLIRCGAHGARTRYSATTEDGMENIICRSRTRSRLTELCNPDSNLFFSASKIFRESTLSMAFSTTWEDMPSIQNRFVGETGFLHQIPITFPSLVNVCCDWIYFITCDISHADQVDSRMIAVNLIDEFNRHRR